MDGSETEEPSDAEEERADGNDLHVLRMLDRGSMEEVCRREELCIHARVFGGKHTSYKQTRCTSTAQEEHSALPTSVINTHEDSDDPNAYSGEQKEVAMEIQELRAAQDCFNQKGWDALGEGFAWSTRSETRINLRLDWG